MEEKDVRRSPWECHFVQGASLRSEVKAYDEDFGRAPLPVPP